MIRNLPVDPARLALIATGHVTPVQEWVELADGSRRPSGNQAREKLDDGRPGAPLWEVAALAPSEDRPELISVQVASHDEPRVTAYGPLHLEGLVARVSVGRDGKLRAYWSATAAREGKGHGPAPAPEKAA